MNEAGFAVAGLQRLSAVDYPGLVSAVVFTQGCNFQCPYCHNPQLIPFREGRCPPGAPSLAEILAFLQKRAGLLDGLVISGGEPTLQPGLADFCRAAKSLGYQVKLDTNGSRPEALLSLLDREVVDYLAVDCKALPGDYTPALCLEKNVAEKLLSTLQLLRERAVPYEVRTTCVEPFIQVFRLEELFACLEDSTWILQPVNLTPAMRRQGMKAVSAESMQEIAFRAAGAGVRARLRKEAVIE